MVKCPYCGNTSGKEDDKGMCISCGGNLERGVPPYPQINRNQPYCGITGSYARNEMITGSSYFFGESGREVVSFPQKYFYMGYDLGIYTPNEIREMLGLPKLSERELFEERCRFGY